MRAQKFDYLCLQGKSASGVYVSLLYVRTKENFIPVSIPLISVIIIFTIILLLLLGTSNNSSFFFFFHDQGSKTSLVASKQWLEEKYSIYILVGWK